MENLKDTARKSKAVKYYNDSMVQRVKTTLTFIKSIMQQASREIRRCDPSTHIEG